MNSADDDKNDITTDGTCVHTEMTTDIKVTDNLVLKTENLTQSTNTGASEARKYSLRSRDKPAQQQNELVSTEKQQDNREKNDNDFILSDCLVRNS